MPTILPYSHFPPFIFPLFPFHTLLPQSSPSTTPNASAAAIYKTRNQMRREFRNRKRNKEIEHNGGGSISGALVVSRNKEKLATIWTRARTEASREHLRRVKVENGGGCICWLKLPWIRRRWQRCAAVRENLRQRWERDLAGRSVTAFARNLHIEELSVKKELENCGLRSSRVQICSRICRNWLKIIFQIFADWGSRKLQIASP